MLASGFGEGLVGLRPMNKRSRSQGLELGDQVFRFAANEAVTAMGLVLTLKRRVPAPLREPFGRPCASL